MLSKEYKNSCVKSGATYTALNGATFKPTSGDEVFAWGSNSSHQLAEGNTDKILRAKLSTSFGSAQQVLVATYSNIKMLSSAFMQKSSHPND